MRDDLQGLDADIKGNDCGRTLLQYMMRLARWNSRVSTHLGNLIPGHHAPMQFTCWSPNDIFDGDQCNFKELDRKKMENAELQMRLLS
eukprot:3477098-Pyramimonas_sp.AAC.1